MSRGQLEDLRTRLGEAIRGSEFEGQVFFAGGCVRDYLLNRPTNDFDLTVALRDGGIALANHLHKKGLASEPEVYEGFGTAMTYLEADDERYKLELVMTRRESYRHRNRKPSVEYGTLEEDVLRRDFTINSLLMKINDGSILDLSGKGRDDLSQGIVRTVADPAVIFMQDPLRLLRALRYATDLEFIIEDDTWTQIIKSAYSILDISLERIAEEMNRIIVLPHADRALTMLRDSGLMKHVLPEVQRLVGLEQNKYHHLDAYDHSVEVFRHCRGDLRLRWAALLHDVGKAQSQSISAKGTQQFIGHERTGSDMARSILQRYFLPKSIIDKICRMIADHMRLKQGGDRGQNIKDKTLRQLIHSYGNDIDLLLELIHADNMAHHPDFRMPEQGKAVTGRMAKLTEQMAEKRFTLTGMDIIHAFNIDSSPLVGRLLKIAEEAWLENPDLTSEELIERIRENKK